ncbi:hypothetical protein AB3M83_07865 [Microbacterium sp. 179-B 1A2 NHS]|uniref:hypothetical protein n=1 Tax=Microbacterium sp. 179-B 1A2 NHS TaxID=3142383 RepID=UPI0039A18F90
MTTTPSTRTARTPSWLFAAVAGAFGLLYAFLVWHAVGFLVAQASSAVGLNGAGWAILLSAVAFPIVVFVAGAIIGRRRPVWQAALLWVAGLGLAAVFWIDVLAYAFVGGESLVGG